MLFYFQTTNSKVNVGLHGYVQQSDFRIDGLCVRKSDSTITRLNCFVSVTDQVTGDAASLVEFEWGNHLNVIRA